MSNHIDDMHHNLDLAAIDGAAATLPNNSDTGQ
jgi:hypothetical protein